MSQDVQCPTLEELEAFALGKVTGANSLRIKLHLEHCHSCIAVFQALSPATMGTPYQGPRLTTAPTLGIPTTGPKPDHYSFLLPPVEPDEIGRLGNYRVLSVLGKGGMGIVFRAEDLSLHRPVALKVMRPEMNADPDGWQRFLREARTMARIKHDHLVTIYWAGQEGDIVYFAMELLEGESLEGWMKRVPQPDIAEILRIGKDVAAGLAFIHQNHLIHRDIKPANIWLEGSDSGRTRRVKILDLGLVRPTQEDAKLTMSGVVMGTPEFMSPEQARGDPVDAQTDLFSLGCVLYCLCTGRKPFQGQSASAIFMALASETPPPAVSLNPQLPKELSELVMQMLARAPKKRPASAQEVVQRLEQIEQSLKLPVDQTHPIKFESGPKGVTAKLTPPAHPTSHRNTVILLAAGLALVAGFFLMGVCIIGVLKFLPDPPVKLAKKPPGPDDDRGEKWVVPKDAVFVLDLPQVAREHYPATKGPDKGPDFKKKKGPKKGGKDGKDFDMTVIVSGKLSPRGIFMHPPGMIHEGQPASLSFKLDRQYHTFHADVSQNDSAPGSAIAYTFTVYGDDNLLWTSKPVAHDEDRQSCKVDVKGVTILKLAVTCPGPPEGAHAVWIDPYVLK